MCMLLIAITHKDTSTTDFPQSKTLPSNSREYRWLSSAVQQIQVLQSVPAAFWQTFILFHSWSGVAHCRRVERANNRQSENLESRFCSAAKELMMLGMSHNLCQTQFFSCRRKVQRYYGITMISGVRQSLVDVQTIPFI